MEPTSLKIDRDAFSCVICLDLLKNPVTIPCGHSYCRSCLQSHWDREEGRGGCSCPQCRRSFAPRPGLVKNTMLAFLVEELKRPPQPEAPEAPEPEVSCDLCGEAGRRAAKSCLQCLASFCEGHLQPHLDAAALQRHQLVAPCPGLQDAACSEHGRAKEMFCRTDRELLCSVCAVERHQGHGVTTAAAERAPRQKELESTRRGVLESVQATEEELQRLQTEAGSIARSAQEAVERSGESFSKLIRVLERRRSQAEKEIRLQQEAEEGAVQQLQEQLQRALVRLRRTVARLDALALTPDHNQFFRIYPTLVKDGKSRDSNQIQTTLQFSDFSEVTDSVSALVEKLQQTLNESESESETKPVTIPSLGRVESLLRKLPAQPSSREDFLKYAVSEMVLDPNTAHTELALSHVNRTVTYRAISYKYASHPERFSDWRQVLGRRELTGRCYVEVEWSAKAELSVALSQRDVKRKGRSSKVLFGHNRQSWAVICERSRASFWFDGVQTPVGGPVGRTIGVYLDHGAGALSFYSVAGNEMVLLHRVQTGFSQPLLLGLGLYGDFTGDTAHLPRLDQD